MDKTIKILNIVLVALLIIGAPYVYWKLNNMESQNRVDFSRQTEKILRLDAGIKFESKRQQYLLESTKEMLKVNKNLRHDEAYRRSEVNLFFGEKYSVDPNLLLAIENPESGFDKDAVSEAGAIGFTQIYPPTARMLFRILGWEYNRILLFDPDRSTELCALYINILYAEYQNIEQVLAHYNGGYWGAHYYKTKNPRLHPETKEYVPKVLAHYRKYKKKLGRYLDITNEGGFEIIGDNKG